MERNNAAYKHRVNAFNREEDQWILPLIHPEWGLLIYCNWQIVYIKKSGTKEQS